MSDPLEAAKEAQKKAQYQIIPAADYVTIRLVGALNPDFAAPFQAEVKAVLKDPFPHVIINCDHLSEMGLPWTRALMAVKMELKKVNKDIRFILVPKGIKEQFKNDGLDSSFKACGNLRDALVDLGLVTKKALDTDFINPFLSGTLRVLQIQASTVAKPGKIFLKTDKSKFSGDISGVIGIVSESFNGSVVISFPEATFLKIMSKMMGETFTELTREISDGAGELTNMIFGQAKVVLNEKGYGIKTALPSVVSGKNHSVESLTAGPIVIIPFESDAGPFFIEICLST